MPLDSNSAEYYRQREAHERELAERAELAKAREIHFSLAERYRFLAQCADETDKEDREPNRRHADTTLWNL